MVDAREVLDRAGDAHRDIQVRRHHLVTTNRFNMDYDLN